MEMPSKLKLTYFDAGGRAEPIRAMLKYAGIAFRDERIPRRDFAAMKPFLQLPFDQVPTLHVDGTVFAQSIAISRYVAKLSGLYPEDSIGALEADLAVDTITEATMAFIQAAFQEQDEEKKKQLLKDANDNVLPRLLGGLEKRVLGPYYLGDAVSYPDFYILDFHKQIWTAFPHLVKLKVDDYPRLKTIATSLSSSSQLQN